MKKNIIILLLEICCVLLYGCIEKEKVEVYAIKSAYSGEVIGDSIVVNGKLSKLIFNKYSKIDDVDSIVYNRDRSGRLLEQNSFYQGIPAFERIIYDNKTGNIKKYIFQNPHCDTCVFVREYDEYGFPLRDSGKLFFMTRVDNKINPATLEVIDDGEKMHIWHYYPKPPGSFTSLYVLFENEKFYAFHQNEVIPYMMEGWVSTLKHEKEISIIDIGMDFVTIDGDTMSTNKPFYYIVVDR